MNFKRISAAALCAAMVLSLTACDEAQPQQGAVTSDGGLNTTTSATTTTNTLDDDINNPVDITDFVEAATLENPNLVYFGHYDMRVAGDIKPGVKLFEETYGGKIDYLQCAWGERIDKLQTLIASGDSPDLVDKEDLTFPNLISKNVYEDLTAHRDLTQPQWAGYDVLVEQYAYNGGHYYYPFTANALPNCLIYNKTKFDGLGLDDPKAMYDAGTWTWDSFKNIMIDFMDRDPDAVGGVYGLLGHEIIVSTGTPLIGMQEGKVVNNMNTAEVERAANYLTDLRKEGLAVRGDGMWSNESAPLVTGKVAFLGVGQWKITDFCKLYKEYEFGFVPFPRDPSADESYYNTTSFGYMVPKGSENVEGAAAFIDIMRRCGTDPELKAVVKESIMNDKQYSEEQYEFLTSFENIAEYNMVLPVSGGISANLTTVLDDMVINLAFEQGENQKSWTQLRTEYEVVIASDLSVFTE